MRDTEGSESPERAGILLQVLRAIATCAVAALLVWLGYTLGHEEQRGVHRYFGYPSASPDGKSCVVWEMYIDGKSGAGATRLWLADTDGVFLLADSRSVRAQKAFDFPQAMISKAVWHSTQRKIAWIEQIGDTSYLALHDADMVTTVRTRIASPAVDKGWSARWNDPLAWLPGDGGIVAVFERWQVEASDKVVSQQALCEISPSDGKVREIATLDPPVLPSGQTAYTRDRLFFISGRRLHTDGPTGALPPSLASLRDICWVSSDGDRSILMLQRCGEKRLRILTADTEGGAPRQLMEAERIAFPKLIGKNSMLVVSSRGEGKGSDLLHVDDHGRTTIVWENMQTAWYDVARRPKSTVVWVCSDEDKRTITRLVLQGPSVAVREDMEVTRP